MSDLNPNDEAPAEPPGENKPRAQMTPVRWVIAIVLVVTLVILYYGLLDRYTPITSDCYVQAKDAPRRLRPARASVTCLSGRQPPRRRSTPP